MGHKGRKVTLPSEEGQGQGLSTPFAPALTLEVCGHPETPGARLWVEPERSWDREILSVFTWFHLRHMGLGRGQGRHRPGGGGHVEGHPTIIGASGLGLMP